MKYFILVFSIVLFFFSCHKGSKTRPIHSDSIACRSAGPYEYLENYNLGTISTDSLCQNYRQIWKDIVMQKNHLTDSFFTNHIKIFRSDTTSWNDGVSFEICYEVQTDWAIAYNCDQFAVKIDSGVQEYASFPRGVFYSKQQILEVLNKGAFSSKINNIDPASHLQFPSLDSGLQYLIEAAKVNTLCFGDVRLNGAGHLQMEAFGQYKYKENACIRALLDLNTGETTVFKTLCYID